MRRQDSWQWNQVMGDPYEEFMDPDRPMLYFVYAGDNKYEFNYSFGDHSNLAKDKYEKTLEGKARRKRIKIITRGLTQQGNEPLLLR